MNNRFGGQVALVTGAASGIGLAVMNRLASEGATVVATDRNAESLAAAVKGVSHDTVVPVVCDVSVRADIEATVATAMARCGKIDILVNSAGVANRDQLKLHEIDPEDWQRLMEVNVRGVFLMIRSVIPHMLANGGGAIINLGSVGSFRATANASSYVTSKGAVLMMTRAAAVDYARDNIRVNAVCPGTTHTGILAGLPAEMLQMLEARAPQGRLGTPEEVAALIAFLASDEALHINGADFLIDGGRCAGG